MNLLSASDLDALRRVSELHQQIHREIHVASAPVDEVLPPSAPVARGGRHLGMYRRSGRSVLPANDSRRSRPGEVASTLFVAAEAKLAGVSASAIWYRIRAGKYPGLVVRRVAHNLVFVDARQMKRLPVLSAGGPVNRTGVSSKERAAYSKRWRELRAAKLAGLSPQRNADQFL